jgi:hypothetical protein
LLIDLHPRTVPEENFALVMALQLPSVPRIQDVPILRLGRKESGELISDPQYMLMFLRIELKTSSSGYLLDTFTHFLAGLIRKGVGGKTLHIFTTRAPLGTRLRSEDLNGVKTMKFG